MIQLRNPVHLHILSELVVIGSLVVWMSSYRKRTTSQIEKLLLRIEEQDEKIQRLEQQFQMFQQQQRMSALAAAAAAPPPKPVLHKKPTVVASPPPVAVKTASKPSKPSLQVVESELPSLIVPPPSPVAVAASVESESELDELLQAELAELQASQHPHDEDDIVDISTEDLKKKSP